MHGGGTLKARPPFTGKNSCCTIRGQTLQGSGKQGLRQWASRPRVNQAARIHTNCALPPQYPLLWPVWLAREQRWKPATLSGETAKLRSCSQKKSYQHSDRFPHWRTREQRWIHPVRSLPQNKYQHRDVGQAMPTIFSYPPQRLPWTSLLLPVK